MTRARAHRTRTVAGGRAPGASSSLRLCCCGDFASTPGRDFEPKNGIGSSFVPPSVRPSCTLKAATAPRAASAFSSASVRHRAGVERAMRKAGWLADRQGGLLLPSLLPYARRDIQADRYMRVTKQICEILEPSNYSVIINLPIHRDCLCARPTPSLRQFRPISPRVANLRCSL